MKKVTQHQAIFYQLYKSRIKDPEVYIPIWLLIGEIYVEELGIWGFVRYEVSARMSELYKDKTGAKYYAYRIAWEVLPGDIVDPDLKKFYIIIKKKK